MSTEAIETLREKIAEHELSIELEEAVMAHLQPDMDKFNQRAEGATFSMRRIRQYLNSRENIRLWKKELAAFAYGLNALQHSTMDN